MWKRDSQISDNAIDMNQEKIINIFLKALYDAQANGSRMMCLHDIVEEKKIPPVDVDKAFKAMEAKDFIETPPEDIAADFFTNRVKEDLVGTKLNHYQISKKLRSDRT